MRLKPGPGPGDDPVTLGKAKGSRRACDHRRLESPELRTLASLVLCTALFAPLLRAVLGCLYFDSPR